ncbi:MAG: macro domain-containing protein [Actinomycetota bacterium]|nr:macro domain-containing protein [Actinomycetota bacterium]
MGNGEDSERRRIAGATVVALAGDITKQEVDAIVNAANAELQHGGGVAAAIAKAGGKAVQEESNDYIEQYGPLEKGEAATTTAGDMPARWVVHVAGPVYDEGSDQNEPHLRATVSAALAAAAEAGAHSVAFPAISAGVYGYPRDEATGIIASEVARWLREHEGTLEEVRLVGLDEETAQDFATGIEAAT